ncbi:MAG TPA: DUF3237 domain-containing protein [Acidimicrobiales bacterium]
MSPAPELTALPEGLASLDHLPVRRLCAMAVRFEQMHVFSTPLGTRITAVAGGGELRGPALSGTVAPGGGDWLLVGSDGVARLDIRITVVADDGNVVSLTGSGRVLLTPEGRERFLAGETVGDDEMSGRATLLFETGSERHAWANSVVAVGIVTELAQSHIRYEVYGLDPRVPPRPDRR